MTSTFLFIALHCFHVGGCELIVEKHQTLNRCLDRSIEERQSAPSYRKPQTFCINIGDRT